MDKRSPSLRIEPRWPVALTLLVLLILLTALPNRVRFVPVWFPYLLEMMVLVPMALVPLTHAKARWLRFERTTTLIFCAVVGASLLVSLSYLSYEMIFHSSELSGLQLLTSSIAVWANNVITFALLYWQMDAGGPESRLNRPRSRSDWLFSQSGLPTEEASNWHPVFVDYLFLAYTTATALSPTDTLPLTPRAKLFMMLQSSIALTTTIVVASRAINILGSQG